MAHEAVSALWFSAGLAAAILAYRRVFLPAMVSGFRQDVFELRRELFLLMARGGIDPEHPAYERLREALNGLLRFAERITFLRMAAMMIAWVRAGRPVSEYQKYEDSIQDQTIRSEFAAIGNRMGGLVLKHCIAASPLAWGALALILIAFAALWVARGGPLRGMINRVEMRAEALAEELTVDDGQCAA